MPRSTDTQIYEEYASFNIADMSPCTTVANATSTFRTTNWDTMRIKKKMLNTSGKQ